MFVSTEEDDAISVTVKSRDRPLVNHNFSQTRKNQLIKIKFLDSDGVTLGNIILHLKLRLASKGPFY